jgi:uncharacterized protein YabN with tetrapyrrole methylase and pyrophosphatase domain
MPKIPDPSLAPITRLREIMSALRNPDGGCAWDLEQDFSTIAPYTIEEAYEVADAIDRKSYSELKDELGDLLLQVIFHAQMADEAGLFDFDDVCRSINDKMIRRHPHVFGDAETRDSETQTIEWEAIKAKERQKSSKGDGVLDDLPLALPALKRAQKLQKRAARVGFDWPDAERVLDKDFEEIGDLMFVCTNLGRMLKVDVETATRSANAKFERRFRHIEASLAKTERRPEDASLDEMEALWNAAKMIEKSAKAG